MERDYSRVRFGYAIVIGALMIAISLATIVGVSVLNSRTVNQIERVNRVTLCILLTPNEQRTGELVLQCINNPPTLEELPGIARTSE